MHGFLNSQLPPPLLPDLHVADVVVGAAGLPLPQVDGPQQHPQHDAVHEAPRVVGGVAPASTPQHQQHSIPLSRQAR